MAGHGLAWSCNGGHWLPDWLPGISLPELTTSGRARRRSPDCPRPGGSGCALLSSLLSWLVGGAAGGCRPGRACHRAAGTARGPGLARATDHVGSGAGWPSPYLKPTGRPPRCRSARRRSSRGYHRPGSDPGHEIIDIPGAAGGGRVVAGVAAVAGERWTGCGG